MRLADRIRQTRACSICAPSGGTWACDHDGNLRPGVRCDCRRGFLLKAADRSRSRLTVSGADLKAYRRTSADGPEIAASILKSTRRYGDAMVAWAMREAARNTAA